MKTEHIKSGRIHFGFKCLYWKRRKAEINDHTFHLNHVKQGK